jgi:hypothetical protein
VGLHVVEHAGRLVANGAERMPAQEGEAHPTHAAVGSL